MKHFFLTGVALLICFAGHLPAAILATYEFEQNLNATNVNPAVTMSALTGLLLTDSAQFSYVSAGGPTSGFTAQSGAGSNVSNTAGNSYYQFQVTASPLANVELTSLSWVFGARATGTGTAFTNNTRLRVSIDDGNTYSVVGATTSVATTSSNQSIFADPIPQRNFAGYFIPAGESLLFRIDVWDNTGSNNNRTWLDTITLQGNVTPLPEPSSLILCGLGAVGFWGFRRRRAHALTTREQGLLKCRFTRADAAIEVKPSC